MSEEQKLNFTPGVKKLLKANYAGLKVKQPTVECLGRCLNEFLKMLVQASAEACIDQNKSTMTTAHVVSAVENLGYGQMGPKIKEKSDSINQVISERKALLKERPDSNMTNEERLALWRQIREEAPKEAKLARERRQQQANK